MLFLLSDDKNQYQTFSVMGKVTLLEEWLRGRKKTQAGPKLCLPWPEFPDSQIFPHFEQNLKINHKLQEIANMADKGLTYLIY